MGSHSRRRLITYCMLTWTTRLGPSMHEFDKLFEEVIDKTYRVYRSLPLSPEKQMMSGALDAAYDAYKKYYGDQAKGLYDLLNLEDFPPEVGKEL